MEVISGRSSTPASPRLSHFQALYFHLPLLSIYSSGFCKRQSYRQFSWSLMRTLYRYCPSCFVWWQIGWIATHLTYKDPFIHVRPHTTLPRHVFLSPWCCCPTQWSFLLGSVPANKHLSQCCSLHVDHIWLPYVPTYTWFPMYVWPHSLLVCTLDKEVRLLSLKQSLRWCEPDRSNISGFFCIPFLDGSKSLTFDLSLGREQIWLDESRILSRTRIHQIRSSHCT